MPMYVRLGSTNGMVRSNGSHSQETNANEDDAGGNASLNIIMRLYMNI